MQEKGQLFDSGPLRHRRNDSSSSPLRNPQLANSNSFQVHQDKSLSIPSSVLQNSNYEDYRQNQLTAKAQDSSEGGIDRWREARMKKFEQFQKEIQLSTRLPATSYIGSGQGASHSALIGSPNRDLTFDANYKGSSALWSPSSKFQNSRGKAGVSRLDDTFGKAGQSLVASGANLREPIAQSSPQMMLLSDKVDQELSKINEKYFNRGEAVMSAAKERLREDNDDFYSNQHNPILTSNKKGVTFTNQKFQEDEFSDSLKSQDVNPNDLQRRNSLDRLQEEIEYNRLTKGEERQQITLHGYPSNRQAGQISGRTNDTRETYVGRFDKPFMKPNYNQKPIPSESPLRDASFSRKGQDLSQSQQRDGIFPESFESKIKDLKSKLEGIKTSISFEIDKQHQLQNIPDSQSRSRKPAKSNRHEAQKSFSSTLQDAQMSRSPMKTSPMTRDMNTIDVVIKNRGQDNEREVVRSQDKFQDQIRQLKTDLRHSAQVAKTREPQRTQFGTNESKGPRQSTLTNRTTLNVTKSNQSLIDPPQSQTITTTISPTKRMTRFAASPYTNKRARKTEIGSSYSKTDTMEGIKRICSGSKKKRGVSSNRLIPVKEYKTQCKQLNKENEALKTKVNRLQNKIKIMNLDQQKTTQQQKDATEQIQKQIEELVSYSLQYPLQQQVHHSAKEHKRTLKSSEALQANKRVRQLEKETGDLTRQVNDLKVREVELKSKLKLKKRKTNSSARAFSSDVRKKSRSRGRGESISLDQNFHPNLPLQQVSQTISHDITPASFGLQNISQIQQNPSLSLELEQERKKTQKLESELALLYKEREQLISSQKDKQEMQFDLQNLQLEQDRSKSEFQREKQMIQDSQAQWKQKAKSLANNFFNALGELRESYYKLKQDLLLQQQEVEKDCVSQIHQVKEKYDDKMRRMERHGKLMEEEILNWRSKFKAVHEAITNNYGQSSANSIAGLVGLSSPTNGCPLHPQQSYDLTRNIFAENNLYNQRTQQSELPPKSHQTSKSSLVEKENENGRSSSKYGGGNSSSVDRRSGSLIRQTGSSGKAVGGNQFKRPKGSASASDHKDISRDNSQTRKFHSGAPYLKK